MGIVSRPKIQQGMPATYFLKSQRQASLVVSNARGKPATHKLGKQGQVSSAGLKQTAENVSHSHTGRQRVTRMVGIISKFEILQNIPATDLLENKRQL